MTIKTNVVWVIGYWGTDPQGPLQPLLTKITELVAAGKTNGQPVLETTAEGMSVTRSWVDQASAEEWLQFLQPWNAVMVSSSIYTE